MLTLLKTKDSRVTPAQGALIAIHVVQPEGAEMKMLSIEKTRSDSIRGTAHARCFGDTGREAD